METHSRLLLSFKVLLCFTILSTLWCLYSIDFDGVTPEPKAWIVSMLTITIVYLYVAVIKARTSDMEIAKETYRHEVKCMTKGMLVKGFLVAISLAAIMCIALVTMAIIFVTNGEPYDGDKRRFIVVCLMGSLAVQCTLLYRIKSFSDEKIPLLPL
jgi:hypothetical protein